MNSEPLRFSIVIPLYNKEKYIERAIDSVLSQTVRSFELIVVNDGSIDKSSLLVQNYEDSRIRLINQRNQGVSVARNTGILHAKEEYITFLDADDEWMPDFLENITKLIFKFPNAQAYATAYQKEMMEDLQEVSFSKLPMRPWSGIIENLFKVLIYDSPPITSSTVCIQKKVFKYIGLFPEGIKRGEDIDMWIRLFLYCDIAFTTETKAILHYDDVGSSLMLSGISEENLYALKQLESKLTQKQIPKKYIKDVKKTISKLLGWEIDACIISKKYRQAWQYILDKRMRMLPGKRIKLLLKLILVFLQLKK